MTVNMTVREFEYGASPNMTDTDDDNTNDDVEVQRGEGSSGRG